MKTENKQIASVYNNQDKQTTYREQLGKYKVALEHEFYFEAMLIVYAMMEDRMRSFLYHIGAFRQPDARQLNVSKTNGDLRRLYFGSDEAAENKKLTFDNISCKEKMIRSTLNWAISSDAIVSDTYLDILRSEYQKCLDLPMLKEFCNEQFVSKGMIADFAIHDKGDGNPHAHILLTLRAMDEHGKWLPKARKVYDLDENGERIRLPSGNWKCHKENTVDWNDQKYAEIWRHSWETITNCYLEAAGRPERVDLRSFERQGIQQIPTVHLGPAAHQMEKRGVETFLGNLNRDIRAANSLMPNFLRCNPAAQSCAPNWKPCSRTSLP